MLAVRQHREAKRASAKAKKIGTAKDAAAVKAVRDAEAQREVHENTADAVETRAEAEEAQADQAPEPDEPAPKKRKQGRQKGYNPPRDRQGCARALNRCCDIRCAEV